MVIYKEREILSLGCCI